MKNCSVKLKRLSVETLQRYLSYGTDITHNIDVIIHDNEMKIGNCVLKSINCNFCVELKISSDQVTVVDPRGSFSDQAVCRNLRTRLNVLNSKSNYSSKKSKLTVATCQSKPIHKIADDAWRKCKKKHKQNGHQISINDIVMAKLRGYSAWPAIVVDFVNKKRAKVEFFGVDQNEKFGFVNLTEITRFNDSAEVILLLLKRNIPKFKKSVLETELFCEIPSSLSLCRE